MESRKKGASFPQAFENDFSSTSEQEGEFESEIFLAEKNPGFPSHTAKYEYFAESLSEQIVLINDIISEIENSTLQETEKEIIERVFTDNRSKKLSKQQRLRIKEQVVNFVDARRRLSDLQEKYQDPKALVFEVLKRGSLELKGDIEVSMHDLVIEVYAENDDDFFLLIDEDKNIYKHLVAVRLAGLEVPLIILRGGNLKREDNSNTEAMEDIERHEKRHVRNGFLLSPEDTKELNRAKDEIVAHLDGRSSFEFMKERFLSLKKRSGLPNWYAYGLEGEKWRDHCKVVREALNAIETLEEVNLDVLAMMKLEQWSFIAQFMNKFTTGESQAIVPIRHENVSDLDKYDLDKQVS